MGRIRDGYTEGEKQDHGGDTKDSKICKFLIMLNGYSIRTYSI